MRLQFRHSLLVIALLALALAVFFGVRQRIKGAAPKAGNPVQAVRTAPARQQSIPITLRANGSVSAIRQVDVRPQIQNVVRAVHVVEGQEVRAGQLLFTLDARGDESNVAKARAQLASQRADLADAEQALRRNQELLAKKFVSQAVVDSARNKVDALRSALEANRAALEASSIAAGYNRIYASIAGRIGAISVHVGSLAQPNGAPLLSIVQLDPIAVSFAVPERELAHIRASYPDGGAPVVARLPNGGELAGRLSFIDNSADPQSGTVLMKAHFANPERQLWPGGFVNVRLTARTLADAVTIPAQGVITGPADTFAYVLQPDQTVKPRKIEVVVISDGVAAVSGLAAGERVVVEGAQNLRPGAKVREARTADAAARQAASASAS